MRLFAFLILLIHCSAQAFTFSPSSSVEGNDFLSVEQAFQLSLSSVQDGKLTATWGIKDGYYLYQQRFALSGDDADKLHFAPFPIGEDKTDPYFGDVIVYHHQVSLPIYYDINLPAGTNIKASLMFQGCADRGLCYPPQTVPLEFTVPQSNIQTNNTNNIQTGSTNNLAPSEYQSVTTLLQSSSVWTAAIALFGLGLLLSLTPCVLPMVPIVSAIVVGVKQSKVIAFYYSLVYVLAMALTYAFIGGLVGIFGLQLNLQAQLQSPILLGISAAIFIILAFAMFGAYELKLPSSWQQKLQISTQHSSSLWRSSSSIFIAGVLSTLIVSPCVSAPLAGTLLYISTQGNAWYGAMMLFIMALGMGTPLLFVGLFGPKILPKSGEWLDDIKHIMGLGLLAVAVWLFTRWLPFSTHLYLWGALAIAASAYFLHRIHFTASHPIRWFIAILFFIIGVLQLLGGALGNIDPAHPLKGHESVTFNSTSQDNQNTHTFDATIESLEELNELIAKQDKRPVVLDLYADWCISCLTVEAMFASADLQPLIKDIQLVRVDVTKNSPQNQALMQEFNLFGPPSLIFLDTKGDAIPELTIMGEPTKKALFERLTLHTK